MLLDSTAMLSKQHIDELHREAARERVARSVRRGRKLDRPTPWDRLRPAVAR
jgi:hypothetical protein